MAASSRSHTNTRPPEVRGSWWCCHCVHEGSSGTSPSVETCPLTWVWRYCLRMRGLITFSIVILCASTPIVNRDHRVGRDRDRDNDLDSRGVVVKEKVCV